MLHTISEGYYTYNNAEQSTKIPLLHLILYLSDLNSLEVYLDLV